MKNLFDATVANQVKTRLGKLEPQSERRWGKMTAAQMLAHCSVSMQWAVGEVVPEKAALPARLKRCKGTNPASSVDHGRTRTPGNVPAICQ